MLPEALDLLEKMLIFDPNKRITGTYYFVEEIYSQHSLLLQYNHIDVVFSLICS